MLAVLEIPQYGFQILRPLTAELKTFRKEELLAYPFLDFPQPVIHLYKPYDLLLYQRTATTILYPVSRDSLFKAVVYRLSYIREPFHPLAHRTLY